MVADDFCWRRSSDIQYGTQAHQRLLKVFLKVLWFLLPLRPSPTLELVVDSSFEILAGPGALWFL